MGIAGFSAILIGLSRPAGGFNPPEIYRLKVLIYASMGAMFFALFPFALFESGLSDSTNWRLLAIFLTVYLSGGIIYFPVGSIRLRGQYPELFPVPLIVVQFSLHAGALILSLMVLLRLTAHQANAYTMALILLLVHGAIAFVRTLFYRRE